MKSFKILIENNLSSTWEEILSKHYGVPADRENNGLHWKVENYSDGNMTGNISIGKWHKPKKDNQSKLHIQSNEKGNLLPAHYVHHVLPKLFEEVQACQTLPRQDAPRVAVTSKQVKSKQAASKCKECDFDGRSVSGLNAHMKTTHRNKTKTSILKSTQSLGIVHSISVEDFSAKFDMEESTDASIHVQESAKKNDGGSILQESEFKESLDTSTHVEERTCDGSSILQEENPAQPSPEKSDDPEKRSKQETVRNHENISIPREDNEENTSVKREASKENISVNGLDNDAEGLVEGNGQPSGSTSSQKPQIKIPSNEIKPRKMQQRPKPLGFACKYCEKKFSTVTQLTSHMKACHTKVDDGEMGNALTVNSPLLTVKHFFCHCSICGNGYDDYSKLSLHESEVHNYACEVCEESFMTKNDLRMHVGSKHGHNCHFCEKTFDSKVSLKEHEISYHKKCHEISCQTNAYNCDACESTKVRLDLMATLENEHINLKEEHAQFKKHYFEQSVEITEIRQKNEEIEEERQKLKSEVEKMKRNAKKLEKDHEAKMNEMNKEMQNAFKQVDEFVQENEKLQEEVKTLDELRKVNEQLMARMAGAKLDMREDIDVEIIETENQDNMNSERLENDDENDDDNESVRSIDDYSDDEEVTAFYENVMRNKSTRTNPQFEAEGPKDNIKGGREPRIKCSKCEFKAKNKAQLNGHIKEKHAAENYQCDHCKFNGNNRTDLAWHIEAIHQKKETQAKQTNMDDREVCKFWMRGYCKFQENQCRFKHYGVERCNQGNSCSYWPYCRYSHYNGNNNGNNSGMCRYQSECRRNNCAFQHMEPNFLEGNWGWGARWGVPEMNMQNFPPLMSQEAPWRPW